MMRPVNGDGLKLHLGCGSTVVPGWENIDKSPSARVPVPLRSALHRAGVLSEAQAAASFPRGIVHADVRKPLRYGDGTVAYVYSSHMIEHLARWQALALLRECRRVLGPGGVVRIATPDLSELVEQYRRGQAPAGATPADSFMEQLLTYRDPPANRLRTVLGRLLTAPHQWLYDRESLVFLLREAGFPAARVAAYRESGIPDIELLEDRPESLFVEAVRT
jgi:predicted SAM-dependent methyltransferase